MALKFAIIGVGYIGKRYIQLIDENPETELVACCDEQPLELAVPCFQSMDELFQSGVKIDVVCVCSPSGMHASHVNMALENGCHVICEKPLTFTRSQAETIMTNAQKVGKRVFCVVQNRFSPVAQWLKQIVSDGLLGNIFMVQTNCYWNRSQEYYTKSTWHGSQRNDGGVLFTQFSHFVDLLYWVFGDTTNERARFSNFTHQSVSEVEDTACVFFDFVRGGIGSLQVTTATYERSWESSITIIAQNGTVRISGQNFDEVSFCNIENYQMPTLAAPHKSNHAVLLQNAVDAINGKTEFFVPMSDTVRVVDIIERIYTNKL